MDSEQIMAINPGATSTKLGLFCGERKMCEEVLPHDARALGRFKEVWAQFNLRVHTVRLWTNPRVHALSAVVGRGGLFRPVRGGTYRVNERMLEDAQRNNQGEHASNMGCAMADVLAREYHCPAFVVDPVSVDEFESPARFSGHPIVQRRSLSHALNIHATAYRAARELGVPPLESSFVIAHLGSGISVAPVRNGRIIDVNDASSDGPFSPERSGGLPLQQLITLCFSETYSEAEVRSLVAGKGGLVAYLGTSSAVEVEERIRQGDSFAREVYEAMAYQISKEIGAMATVVRGHLSAIVLTGGLARSAQLTSWITDRVKFIARVIVLPGEDELQALAFGALRVLRGEEEALEY